MYAEHEKFMHRGMQFHFEHAEVHHAEVSQFEM